MGHTIKNRIDPGEIEGVPLLVPFLPDDYTIVLITGAVLLRYELIQSQTSPTFGACNE